MSTKTVGFSKIGVLAGLGASICWACGIVLFKIILVNNDPFVLAAVRMLFLLPTLGIIVFIIALKTIVRKKNNKPLVE